MIAWFQGHIEGGALRLAASFLKCMDFGMWGARLAVIPLPHYLAVLDYHRAHHGIWRSVSYATTS
jgi:hypothetical protein